MKVRGPSMLMLCLLAPATFLTAASTQADETPDSPIEECVGRSELTLPSDAEAALYSIETVARLAKPPATLVQARFTDGQVAGYTQWQYRGDLYVTRPVTSAQVADVLRRFGNLEREDRAYAARKKVDDSGTPLSYEQLSDSTRSRASRLGSSYLATWNLSDIVVHWSSVVGADDTKPNRLAYQTISHSKLRAPFQMPDGPGVCLPSLFIPDDGKTGRFIASTYRLKQHPDVTVWIQDRDADGVPPAGKLGQLEQAAKDGDFFWTQNYQHRKSFRSLWSLPHPIDAPGVVGVASLVELTRDDDTLDYGYFASFRGTSDSSLGDTQIKMFVIRDADIALQKGIKPVDKAAFVALAESIQRSVRARKATAP